jgi:hypothetical protein
MYDKRACFMHLTEAFMGSYGHTTMGSIRARFSRVFISTAAFLFFLFEFSFEYPISGFFFFVIC